MGLFNKKEENIKKGFENTPIKNEPQKSEPFSKETKRNNYPSTSSEGIISKGLTISGKITGNANLKIYGEVEGEIDISADVIVENGSSINADIKGRNVEISGVVNGNVTAKEKILLKETAIVVGNITCKSFIVKEGASFEGNINMIHSSNQQSGQKKPDISKK